VSRKICLISLFIAGLPLLLSCSTSFTRYSGDMFQGKRLYRDSDYVTARSSFLRASQEERTSDALAWAATASYKMNDLATAERLIAEAQSIDSNSLSSLRIRGFKALILLSEGRGREGMEGLREYLALYRGLDPLMSISEVERLASTGTVNPGGAEIAILERAINEQVEQYESDVEQFNETGTGYYGQKWESQFGGL